MIVFLPGVSDERRARAFKNSNTTRRGLKVCFNYLRGSCALQPCVFMGSCVYIIQISMNVMTTMVAVVRYATTLKEAMNVLVEMAMNWILMDEIVQVHLIMESII